LPPLVSAKIVGLGPSASGKNLLVTDQEQVELEARISRTQTPVKAWVTKAPLRSHGRDQDKVHFDESRGRNDLSMKTRVRLDEGTNLIYVISRDENDLTGRKVLVIRRE